MPTSDPLDILIAHDPWATLQILQACEKLTPAQFAQKFDIGPGSLQAAATHIIGAMRAWNDNLAGRPSRPRIEQNPGYTPAQLAPLLDEAAADLVAQAKRLPLDQMITRVREGKEYKFTRGAAITHITTHSMHHRAQCLNMLKQLGIKPLPPSSVTEWAHSADSAQ
jgi:uncharacterized damage-inducible protein DinB